MSYMRATPRRVHPRGAYVALVKPSNATIAHWENERERRDNFERGSRWAAFALVGLFAFLSMGCVMWGW